VFPAAELVYTDIYMVGVPYFLEKLLWAQARTLRLSKKKSRDPNYTMGLPIFTPPFLPPGAPPWLPSMPTHMRTSIWHWQRRICPHPHHMSSSVPRARVVILIVKKSSFNDADLSQL
jgi:hypothetical protein